LELLWDARAEANELGRRLLALEGYMQLNQTGFVKICKKHDKVCSVFLGVVVTWAGARDSWVWSCDMDLQL
jgi:SPX domain protein involved in polyphosphate accumulation